MTGVIVTISDSYHDDKQYTKDRRQTGDRRQERRQEIEDRGLDEDDKTRLITH